MTDIGSCWYTDRTCPKCGSKIATNGRMQWCTGDTCKLSGVLKMSDKHTVVWENGQDRIIDNGASYFKQFRHPLNGWTDEEDALEEPWLLAFIEDYHNLKSRQQRKK